MITWKKHFIYLADYQHWANEALFTSLDHLSDDARKSDQQLLHHSMHQTIDHILLINRLWLARLRHQPFSAAFNQIHYPDWRELKTTLQKETRQFQHWLEAQPDVFFEESLSYASVAGHTRENWVRDILTHIFNQATHHRAQVAAMALRLGAPVAELDYLIYKQEVADCLDELAHQRPGN